MKMCIPSSKLNKQKSVWFLCEGKGSLIIPSEARPTVLPGHALWGWVALKAPAGTASPKPSFGRTKAECSSGTHGRAPPQPVSCSYMCELGIEDTPCLPLCGRKRIKDHWTGPLASNLTLRQGTDDPEGP